jgi:hypothetical protein
MSATVQFSESNTAGEVVTDGLTNLNMGNSDSANLVAATYKITAGNNAYEKYVRIKFSGTFTEISNLVIWKSAGVLKTGEVVKAIANQTFSTPTTVTSTKAVSAIPTSEGAGLAIESGEVDPTKFTTPGYSKYIVIQLQTTTSTPPGGLNTKTISISWDEY